MHLKTDCGLGPFPCPWYGLDLCLGPGRDPDLGISPSHVPYPSLFVHSNPTVCWCPEDWTMRGQNLQGVERWLKKEMQVLERTKSNIIWKLMHGNTSVSFLQWHFLIFPFHTGVNSKQTLHFFHDDYQSFWHSFKYFLRGRTEPGYIPQRLFKHFWGKKNCANTCSKNLCGQMALFWGNNKTKNNTAFETQVLWKYSSDKEGHFQPYI